MARPWRRTTWTSGPIPASKDVDGVTRASFAAMAFARPGLIRGEWINAQPRAPQVIWDTFCHNDGPRGVLCPNTWDGGGGTMAGNTTVVVIGDGYACVMAVAVTPIDPRPRFVHRVRPHRLLVHRRVGARVNR